MKPVIVTKKWAKLVLKRNNIDNDVKDDDDNNKDNNADDDHDDNNECIKH